MVLDRGYVIRRLTELGIRPSKRLGQSFLVSAPPVAAIVDAARRLEPSIIVEIGAGLGALTLELARIARVIAVEVDGRLADALRKSTADRAEIDVMHADIRNVELPALIGDGSAVVVGSIPYRITADILRWLVRARGDVDGAVLLTQIEAARKILRSPGRDGSALGVFVQAYAETVSILDVGRSCFHPVPEVDSLIWGITWRDAPAFRVAEESFFEVVRALYGARRKMVRSALRSLGEAERIDAALDSAAIDPQRRGETLGMEELERLAAAWASAGG